MGVTCKAAIEDQSYELQIILQLNDFRFCSTMGIKRDSDYIYEVWQ